MDLASPPGECFWGSGHRWTWRCLEQIEAQNAEQKTWRLKKRFEMLINLEREVKRSREIEKRKGDKERQKEKEKEGERKRKKERERERKKEKKKEREKERKRKRKKEKKKERERGVHRYTDA